jgi:hypothetical protein
MPAESEYVLEDMSEFSKFKEPSKQFLRFAEYYLSNGKADSEHYHTVSFKNCLLRIPCSYNSKNMSKVSIVQKWKLCSKLALFKSTTRSTLRQVLSISYRPGFKDSKTQ